MGTRWEKRWVIPSWLLLSPFWAVVLFGTAVAATAPPSGAETDSDGDGLSDFQEIHKYCTDPKKQDTAGKGVADSDPNQRREFTYSIRAVIRVIPPYNLKTLNDDYQDVRVLKETKEYAELEVVLYPLNTNAAAITANPHWKSDYAGMKEFLAPGITTNWDEKMRKDLVAELAQAGIDPDKLTDQEVVERVSRWFYGRSKHRTMFCTNFVQFFDGKAAVRPGLEKAFQREKGDPNWSDEEQFAHELFGREMFYRKIYGTCTSAAVAQATILRAVGIPTRIIGTIPLVDASDPGQMKLAQNGLTHHRIRQTISNGLSAAGNSYASHTYLEVFVGHRWRRLNYTTLGQNVLDSRYFGLMIHVHTFNDLSEAGLAATWGERYALGKRDEVFRHSNPYRTMSINDHFGKYAEVPNVPAPEHKRLTISKLYWADAKDAPETVRSAQNTAGPGNGRLFVHVEEWLDDAGDYIQYRPFLQKADGNFVLRAKGQPDLHCQASGLFITLKSGGIREFEIVIPPEDFSRMARDVAYTLQPAKPGNAYRWETKGELRITRQLTAEEKLDAVLERLERLEKRVQELEKKKDR
jgi:hypothetical protein